MIRAALRRAGRKSCRSSGRCGESIFCISRSPELEHPGSYRGFTRINADQENPNPLKHVGTEETEEIGSDDLAEPQELIYCFSPISVIRVHPWQGFLFL